MTPPQLQRIMARLVSRHGPRWKPLALSGGCFACLGARVGQARVAGFLKEHVRVVLVLGDTTASLLYLSEADAGWHVAVCAGLLVEGYCLRVVLLYASTML